MTASSPRQHGRPWPSWVGGLILLVVVYGPPAVVGSLPAGYRLSWHAGGLHVEVGTLLALLPGMALLALIAPLVLYRRRDALISLLPWGLIIVWIFGARLAVLAEEQANRNLRIATPAVNTNGSPPPATAPSAP